MAGDDSFNLSNQVITNQEYIKMPTERLEIDRWGYVTLCTDYKDAIIPDDRHTIISSLRLGNIEDGRPVFLPPSLDAEWDRLKAEWDEDMRIACVELSEMNWTYRMQQGF